MWENMGLWTVWKKQQNVDFMSVGNLNLHKQYNVDFTSTPKLRDVDFPLKK